MKQQAGTSTNLQRAVGMDINATKMIYGVVWSSWTSRVHRCCLNGVDVIFLHKENSANPLNRNSNVAVEEQKNIESSESEWHQQHRWIYWVCRRSQGEGLCCDWIFLFFIRRACLVTYSYWGRSPAHVTWRQQQLPEVSTQNTRPNRAPTSL